MYIVVIYALGLAHKKLEVLTKSLLCATNSKIDGVT